MNIWHFEYNLEADPVKQVMFEKIYGVWRPATAKNYVRDFEAEAIKLIDRPWAKLIDGKATAPAAKAVVLRKSRRARVGETAWQVRGSVPSGAFIMGGVSAKGVVARSSLFSVPLRPENNVGRFCHRAGLGPRSSTDDFTGKMV